jgi:hypothetical protein
MDKGAVQDFYRNEAVRESVKEYIELVIKEETIQKAFKREDTSHIADAKELIERAFKKMANDFSTKPKQINNNPR